MKKIFILLLISSIAFNVNAQKLKTGITLGAANYLGDIDGYTTIPSFGISASWHYNDKSWKSYFIPKIALNYQQLSGDDALAGSPDIMSGINYKALRNLHFKSPVLELAGQLQIGLPHYYVADTESGKRKNRFAPFISLGASVFHFNPKAQFEGEWYDLQPLGTEGQNFLASSDPYRRISTAILTGFGLKYAINDKIELELEYMIHHTSTDYIDDVSTIYYDPEGIAAAVSPELSEAAAYLSDPSEGLLGVGEQRGYANDKDKFLTGSVSIYYRF